MPDHVMRHPWSTPGHPLKAHQAAPNHVRWGIWAKAQLFRFRENTGCAQPPVIPAFAGMTGGGGLPRTKTLYVSGGPQ